MEDEKKSTWVKWTAGIVASVIGGLILFALTRENGPFNHPPPPTAAPMGGKITDIKASVQRPCCTFSVQVSLGGFNGQQCHLRWTLIDANTGQDAYGGSENPGREGITLTPEAGVDQARVEASVPISTAGQYFVRFGLYDPDEVELDRSDTNSFNVTT
jgi:hypothetical protein